jgi:hypothetical protein
MESSGIHSPIRFDRVMVLDWYSILLIKAGRVEIGFLWLRIWAICGQLRFLIQDCNSVSSEQLSASPEGLCFAELLSFTLWLFLGVQSIATIFYFIFPYSHHYRPSSGEIYAVVFRSYYSHNGSVFGLYNPLFYIMLCSIL